jgi:hypothetical protein
MGRGIMSSIPAQAKLVRPYLKKQDTNKRTEGIGQVVEH